MERPLRIAGIVEESIVDGPGIRFVVFAQGCKHGCSGCHNPHTHSFDGGTMIDADWVIAQMKKNPLLDGITLSGGEPFEQAEAFGALARKAKAEGYNVMTYTGYSYEYIYENKEKVEGWNELLSNTNVLVDGRFEISKKNYLLPFRGSENQRVIDVSKTINTGMVLQLSFS